MYYDNMNYIYLRKYYSDTLNSSAISIIHLENGEKTEFINTRVKVDDSPIYFRLKIALDKGSAIGDFNISNNGSTSNQIKYLTAGRDNTIYLAYPKSSFSDNTSYYLYCHVKSDEYGNDYTCSGTIKSIDIIFPTVWITTYNNMLGIQSDSSSFNLAEDGYYWCNLEFYNNNDIALSKSLTSVYVKVDNTNILGVTNEKCILFLNKGVHYISHHLSNSSSSEYFSIFLTKINLMPSNETIKAIPNSIKMVHKKNINTKTLYTGSSSGTSRSTSNNYGFLFEEFPFIIPYEKMLNRDSPLITGELYDIGEDVTSYFKTYSYSFLELN